GEVLPCCCTVLEPIMVDCQRIARIEEEPEDQFGFTGLNP
ncbi:MAG TPA: (Fe-S)-binding protein, partial [Alcaligenes faecalis]|nr:(Fe-S)-binding protein [Alcaligenes faecalis]